MYRRLLALVALALLFIGTACPRNLGANVQPAKQPILLNVGAYHWPADTNGIGYTGGFGFQIVVKHTLFNELNLKVVEGFKSTDIPRVDNWPPSGPAQAVYRKLETLDTDVNLLTETVLLHIYPAESFGTATPLARPPDGTKRTYQIYEVSADANLSGSAKVSDPAVLTLVVWNEPCVVPLFDVAPTNLTDGTQATVTWRADSCKNVKVLEWVFAAPPFPAVPGPRDHVIEEKTFVDQPAGSLSGTTAVTVSQVTTALGIRASSATGKTWMDSRDLQVNPAGPCPANQPNGTKKWFDFCETCLGKPPNQTSVHACDLAKAREEENKWLLGTNCTAADGACFAGGSGMGGPVIKMPDAGPLTPEGCCCRPGSGAPICHGGEAEWACRNTFNATWKEGACP
jgi:hypothetical protein